MTAEHGPKSPSQPPLAFLDANILFSAALGGPAFVLLWELAEAGKVRLCSSPWCVAEARLNLTRKRPVDLARLEPLLAAVARVADVDPAPAWMLQLLPVKDAPVLAAAIAAKAAVLVTGDLRHFGGLMARTDVGVQVQTLRAFLLAGPTGPQKSTP